MKIYISADIEGVSGIVHPEQTMLDGKEYNHARNLMIKEVNAAIEGALAGGATRIVVGDSHSHQFNLLPEDMHPEALLVSGNQKPVSSMLEGLDESYDGLFLIGYHARAGISDGVLNHTYFPKEVRNARLNGTEVGELGINAALAGYYGVPVCLVTGDKAACEEAVSLLGDVKTVAVKESAGKYSALCLHPQTARRQIQEAAEKAVKNISSFKPFKPDNPATIEIDMGDSAMADAASLIPIVERIGDREIRFSGDNILDMHKLFRACLLLASTARNITY